jgi:formylglycine-generating enzyme required for sulfatase activity
MSRQKIINGVRWFFTNPKCVFYLGLVITLVATTLEVTRFRARNFYVFHDATLMFWSGLSPYNMEFVDSYTLFFLYTPVFTTLFLPFALLPDWLGPFAWNIFNYCMFALAIWTLPKPLANYRTKIFLFLLSILLQSLFCFQYNVVVGYIFLFAFSLLERGKPLWAVLLIMISATTKIYGIAELALLFCYPKVWRNMGFALLCGILLLLLPAVNPAADITTLYQELADILTSHHNQVDFPGLLFARGLKPFLLPNYRVVQLGVLAVLGVLFFWRYKRWSDFRFRVQALAIIMGYVILLSDSPETHTYVIALAGYQLAFWLQPQRNRFDWTLYWLLFVNFCILPTDVLCPVWLHHFVHETFWLDIYCMTIAWLMIIWRAVGPEDGRGKMEEVKGKKEEVRGKVLLLLLLLAVPTGMMAQDKTFNVKGISFVMKPVKGGTYQMGAFHKQGADSDELPVHQVRVNDFYLGETEVTQELWKAVMDKNPSKVRGEQYPVERVSYGDCLKFIQKLNQLTGQHFRLPTEEEWEYAARGGRLSKGYLFAGSNNPQQVAWCMYDTIYKRGYSHQPVRTLQPNELGIYDMSGGVWEWCSNDYQYYVTDHTGALARLFRRNFKVIRGGSFNNKPRDARVTNRFMYVTTRRKPTVGLRLAM